MFKYRLMSPGPTPIPSAVLAEMAKPIMHHRTAAFEKIFHEVQVGLKWLYQTKNDVIVIAASGSGGMEASLVNTCSTGENVLIVNGGKFGERFVHIAAKHKLTVDEIKVPWGSAIDPKIIGKKLHEKDFRAVCIQACETSTGVAHPVKEIAALTRPRENTVLIVDAVTSLGVTDIPTDTWGLDFVIGGSQKALMLPPGLATVSVSDKAWKLMERTKTNSFYFDLKAERAALKNKTTAWTPTVSLIVGLKKSLELMQAEGLTNIFARHAKMASSVRAAATACGLKLFAPESPANAVTAIFSPEGIASGKIISGLRDDFNMTIADGQDHVKGKIFRIGHIGYYDLLDMVTVWAAIECQLVKLGHKFTLGSGVAEIIRYL